MIVGVSLPFLTPTFANRPQIFISRVGWAFTIAMLPNHPILARWNAHLSSSLHNGVVAIALVVSPIAYDPAKMNIVSAEKAIIDNCAFKGQKNSIHAQWQCALVNLFSHRIICLIA
jgi:hypothetical protein